MYSRNGLAQLLFCTSMWRYWGLDHPAFGVPNQFTPARPVAAVEKIHTGSDKNPSAASCSRSEVGLSLGRNWSSVLWDVKKMDAKAKFNTLLLLNHRILSANI